MRKSFKIVAFLGGLLCLAGCFSAKPNSLLDKSLAGQPLSPYSGQKAKITVNDFELKTAGLDIATSLSLKEYFVNILVNSRRFVISAPQDADLIISVELVEFIPESSGGKAGLAGGGSSASSFMGGLLGEATNKASMQLGIRIIERTNSNILSSRDIQSQAETIPGKKIKTPADKIFKTGLSDYAGTVMAKVIYNCLIEAGRYVAQNVPQNYYRN